MGNKFLKVDDHVGRPVRCVSKLLQMRFQRASIRYRELGELEHNEDPQPGMFWPLLVNTFTFRLSNRANITAINHSHLTSVASRLRKRPESSNGGGGRCGTTLHRRHKKLLFSRHILQSPCVGGHQLCALALTEPCFGIPRPVLLGGCGCCVYQTDDDGRLAVLLLCRHVCFALILGQQVLGSDHGDYRTSSSALWR